MTSHPDLSRRSALLWLAAITALGGAFRFYNLGWGAPYYHFHIDEHFVFNGAYLLGRDAQAAASSAKFFMYPPLPMYVLNVVVDFYEAFAHPLLLNVPRDEVTFMVLGRAISAAFGTATIPLCYLIASRVAGRLAGVLAALLLACSVLHLRDSHFFTTDSSLVFFSTLTWLYLIRTVQHGDAKADAGTAFSFGLAVLSKYTAVFLAPLIGLAHLLSPRRPPHLRPLGPWVPFLLRAAAPVAGGVIVFLILDPLVLIYYDKFRMDFRDQITTPLLGGSQPQFFSQFADVQPHAYWFTNLLWYGMGPAFEIWGAPRRGVAVRPARPRRRDGSRLSGRVLALRRAQRRSVSALRASSHAAPRRLRRRPERGPAAPAALAASWRCPPPRSSS